MGRSTAAEVALRIDAVYDLLLQGVGRRGIAQYAANHGWQVSARQLDTYARRAKALLAKAAERDRAVELGKTIEQLDLLFMRALTENDRPEARAVLHERTELLGLAAPRRHEMSGQLGTTPTSDAELAVRMRATIEGRAAQMSAQREDHDDGTT